jgi:AcrR family transcriptional regulator
VDRQTSGAVRRRRAAALARRRRETARSARERILATADQLFYGNGIQAVGVQRLIEQSQVTRVTFYRHFPSKDDLVLAYLDQRTSQARSAVQRIIDAYPGDPLGALRAWAVALTEDGMVDEYRGCTFVNAAAEYAEPDHPVRLIAIDQRRWVNETTEQLLREAGHPDPAAAARLLMALRTGYVFSLGFEEDAGWAAQYLAACDRVARDFASLPGRDEAAVDAEVGPGDVAGHVAGQQQHEVGDLFRPDEPAGLRFRVASARVTARPMPGRPPVPRPVRR